MSLPSLTPEQQEELFQSAEGRAVSYIDSPAFMIGDRHSTFVMRDGMNYADAPRTNQGGVCGSMSSLAYSCSDKCRDYLSLGAYIERRKKDLEISEEYYTRASKRNQKRAMKTHAEEIRWAEQDIRNATERRQKLEATYFAGFEGRFLISK